MIKYKFYILYFFHISNTIISLKKNFPLYFLIKSSAAHDMEYSGKFKCSDQFIIFQ